jgi:hypothetical protein
MSVDDAHGFGSIAINTVPLPKAKRVNRYLEMSRCS